MANGRVWQISFDRLTKPVLRWRSLSDGRASSVPVSIPRPRGAFVVSESFGGSDTQLLIASTRGFVSGDWCLEESDEGECETFSGFCVQFDIRTGKVLRSSQPRESPLLIGGTRVSYLEQPEAGPMVLRDAIQRRSSAQDADLQPDGSLWLAMDLSGVLLSVETNGNGSCGPEAGWLTEIGGRRGNTFAGLPHSRGYAISQSPGFMSPTTMSWIEKPTDPRASSGRYRVRVGRDLRDLPLITKDRPRC